MGAETTIWQEQFAAGRDGFAPASLPLREAALARFAEHGFPKTRLEAWRYTKLNALAETALPAAQPMGASAALEAVLNVPISGGVPDLEGIGLPAGLTVASVAETLANDPERLSNWLAASDEDGAAKSLVALNSALMRDGLFIHVAADTAVELPLHLAHRTEGSVAAHVRHIIVLEPGASLSVLESHGGNGAYWAHPVSQIFLGENAELTHGKLQVEDISAHHIAANQIKLEAGATYDATILSAGGHVGRTETSILINGAGAHAELRGVALGAGEQTVDHITFVDHAVPDATSNQLFKAVLDDHAHGVFQGQVLVRKGAQHTKAEQANHNLLLKRTAEADSRPELEIYADDVECAHGATVGELDEAALFYLQARGIPEAQARQLLIEGFIAELFEDLAPESFQQAVLGEVARWLEARG